MRRSRIEMSSQILLEFSDKVGGACSTHWRVKKLIGNKLLGRKLNKYEDNIKIYIQGMELISVECIHLIRHLDYGRALVKTLINFLKFQEIFTKR
jgi:hypothetical protein